MCSSDLTALDCRDGPRIVVVQASLDEAKKALGESPRDHVVMARVDADTAADLDRWVDVGLAKSRSEAAALFLREGLHLRQRDLDKAPSLRRCSEEFRQPSRESNQNLPR